MGRKVTLSNEKRAIINTLREKGYTLRCIAKKLKISKSTVGDAINRYQMTGSNNDRKRTGRPRVTSKAEDKSIVLMSKRNRKLTAPEIRSRFNHMHSSDISVTTVKRRLIKAGVKGKVAIKKPLLRRSKRQKRLQNELKDTNI